MVEAVNYQGRYHYWAGEHFERLGDLPRAVAYYRQGVARDPGERSLNLAGLTRVFEALGRFDSAVSTARAHDSAMSNQLDYPLLPPLLARQGRTAEATATASQGARLLLARGNLQGGVRATLALAEVLQQAGRWDAMLSQAAAAESLASRANLTEEWIQAGRLRGLALLGAARLDAALAVLRRAASRAEAHPTDRGLLQTRVALAEALSAAGRVEEALRTYGAAAEGVERTMARLAYDVDRARYRAAQLAAYDGALRLLLQPAHRGRLDELAGWSRRRKAASLSLASGGVAPGQAGSGAGLA
jgi:tetratricopeptide (TPR) repeat protein